MFKKLWRLVGPNPLDFKLKRAKKRGAKTILIPWNRGLGDIALGLFALVYRIRSFIPDADIIFLTRKDLIEGFAFLEGVRALQADSWKRGEAIDLEATLREQGLSKEYFDLVLENPDPTHWVKWQLGRLTPQLLWKEDWDRLSEPFALNQGCVGVHVQTETRYGYEKNWPIEKWRELFIRMTQEKGLQVVLFGFQSDDHFKIENVVDLRGKTSLFEMLSIIKNRCRYLIAPDSGILSISYYIHALFSIRVVSLWADPRQGVLKQNVASPNRGYEHIPLLGREENVGLISVEEVFQALLC